MCSSDLLKSVMSIFKSTIKSEIAAQLKAREKVISSENRGPDFLRYTTGKNSWVRMASFVNYDSTVFDIKKGTEFVANPHIIFDDIPFPSIIK